MYKCIKSLKSNDGSMYYYGNEVTLSIYNKLTNFEKRHFVKLERDFPQRKKLDELDFSSRIEDSSFVVFGIDSDNNYESPTEQSSSPDVSDSPSVDYGGGDT